MVRLTHRLALSLSCATATLTAQNQFKCGVDHTPPGDADNAMVDQDYARAEKIYTAIIKERPADPSLIAGSSAPNWAKAASTMRWPWPEKRLRSIRKGPSSKTPWAR